MTLIGTIARSDRLPCTDSARVISQLRIAPVMVARMTSLTVPPWKRRTLRKSSREVFTVTNRRCSDSVGADRRLGGGPPVRQGAGDLGDLAADRADGARPGCRRCRTGWSRAAAGRAPSRATASATSAGAPGACCGLPLDVHGLAGLRVDVEDHLAEVDGRDPVDEDLVRLRQDREAAALEPLDEVHLPQRPVPVEPAAT